MAEDDPVKPQPETWWQDSYDSGIPFWYRPDTHPFLEKHYGKLNPERKAKNVIIPLCGKSVDIEWLYYKGIPKVVGVDFILSALQEVKERSGYEWTESADPRLGSESKILTRNDGKMKLYCADMLKFTPEFEGTFEAMWERGAIFILPRKDVEPYVQVLKDLLAPGGRLLMEVMEFDEKSVDPKVPFQPFPPYSMYPDDIRRLFEPECSVELVDRIPCPWTYGRYTDVACYLIIKK